jgi:general secretion pathway protein L
MGQALNSLRQRARNAAHRARLPRFWRWWSGELAPLIPVASRGAVKRRLTRPVVEFKDGEVIFWRPLVVDDELRLTEFGRVVLAGDSGEVATAGRALMTALAAALSTKVAAQLRVVVALPPKQLMRKTLVLPAAVEENLGQALSYDLDRHTPFRPEQVYFDATVIDRKPATKTISVDWVAALKTAVDGARRQVEDWGGIVVAVVPGPMSVRVTRATRLNLIPRDARPHTPLWRRWQLWVPALLVAFGVLAVLAVPLLQKREYAIALNKQTESARAQAEAADALRTQLERQQGDYNYALTRKYAYPGAVQIVDDITRLLPDDTWITQMEVRSATRGKDNVRELTLRGESANAGALISTLEESKLVEQAALQSPTTKLQPGPGEVFVLGSRLRGGTTPQPVPVPAAAAAAAPGSTPVAAATDPAAAPAPAAAGVPAPPPSPTQANAVQPGPASAAQQTMPIPAPAATDSAAPNAAAASAPPNPTPSAAATGAASSSAAPDSPPTTADAPVPKTGTRRSGRPRLNGNP